LGGLAVPTIALTVGWRWAFVAGAAFALVSAWQVPSRLAPPGPAVGGRAGEGRTDVATAHLLTLAIGVGLGAAASGALSSFIVLSGVEAGLSEALAAIMLTLGSLLGIGVRLLVGARADRIPGSALAYIVTMFAVASLAYLLLAVDVSGWHLVGTPLAFATAYAWPGLFHLAVVRANPSAPGRATGIAMIGTYTGAVVGPVFFGATAATLSYTAAWISSALLFVLGAAIVALVRRHFIERDEPVAEAAATDIATARMAE
jgi:predicted MFS family arabinose efflux permease